jgi:prevent-host-death family protein
MPAVSTVEARNEFSTVLNRAAFGKERVILARRGKAIAAIVPMDDVKLLRALEDRADLADAIAAEREALEKGTTSLADLKRDLAL